MPKYDIMITLFTIVYGLMLTDLFLSFHKLIKSRKNVKWHWLPLLAAWYLFLIILKNWWDLSSFQNSADSVSLENETGNCGNDSACAPDNDSYRTYTKKQCNRIYGVLSEHNSFNNAV